jgi:hypothetical protein
MPFNTFVDESARSHYMLCGVNVNQQDLELIRSSLKALTLRGKSRVHMYAESRGRQNSIAREIARFDVSAWLISVSSSTVKQPESRFLAIKSMAEVKSLKDSRIMVLENSNSMRRDNRALNELSRSADFQFPHYRHMNSRHEPLLWLPDIIAWCYGRGGTWRDAVEPLVIEVIEL